jgi:putative protease
VSARVAGGDYRFEFPLGELEPSRTADMAGVLAAQFGRTGDTPFTLRDLAAPAFPAVLIPPARLKEIRRDLYRELSERALAETARLRATAKQRALAALVPSRPARRTARPELLVKLEHLRDATLLHQPGIDAVILPVSRANLHQLSQAGRKFRGDAARIIWQLPFFFGDDEASFYREAVATIAGFGFRRFEVANIAHFALLRGLDLELSTDYRLFSLNSQALLAWQELGAVAATLYIEDDQENLAALCAADLPMTRRIVIYGGVPAMTTRIAIKGVKADAPLVSDRGEEYDLRIRDGLTTVTPAVRFSLTAHRSRLLEMGCGSFVADLSQTLPEQWRRVLDAVARGDALPETSEFNFTMGLV